MQGGFIGKIGDDELGRVFRDSLTDLGVTFPVTPCDSADHPTGNCLVLVTPDAERTMHIIRRIRHHGHGRSGCQTIERHRNSLLRRLCLGQPDRTRGLSGSRSPRQIGRRAHRPFCRILFALNATSRIFWTCLRDIGILLANFAEAQALLDVTDMADITAAMKKAGVDGAITCGAEGAVIVCGDTVVHVDAHAVETVTDLTGAGDQFAAGYLCGVARGRSAQTCGRMVALAAAEDIQHFGPRPEKDLRAVFAAHGFESVKGLRFF